MRRIAEGGRRMRGPKDAMETMGLAGARALAERAAVGEPIGEGAARARIADHFVEVRGEHAERRRREKGPGRMHVLERADGLGAVPGCSPAPVREHHVRFRARSGSEHHAS